MLDDLTVIVPTKNESQNIERFLGSLPKDISLVVVDSSDDDTPDIIADRRSENTLVIEENCNISRARQIGAEAAQSSWLLFTDADVVFPESYFGHGVMPRGAGVIYGPKLSRDAYVRYYKLMARGQQLSQRFGIPAATGSNMIVLKRALVEAGGFDVDLPCNEDSELAWRIARLGYRTLFDFHLCVYAMDHRRLEKGKVTKTQHSVLRCILMYFDLMPDRWRYRDWGYWAS